MSDSDARCDTGVHQPIFSVVDNITATFTQSFDFGEVRGEQWVDRRFINFARRLDRWAQNGPREKYAARRELAYHIRKAAREVD